MLYSPTSTSTTTTTTSDLSLLMSAAVTDDAIPINDMSILWQKDNTTVLLRLQHHLPQQREEGD